jgi:alkylation response protein AidB-like acyl-CoA dehydrogenase
MSVPKGLGGAGFGMLAYYVCWKELFRTCGPANWLMLYAISHWDFGPSQVLERVTPHAQNETLGPMMAGEQSMCFGSSETGTGSDASKLTTKAIGDGYGCRISGRKIWTSNAPVADFCIVFARTESGEGSDISAILVPSSSPGFHIERIIKMFGSIGGDEAELRFEDVKVEPWQLFGRLHQRFATAIFEVSIGRIYNSARAVGYGRWALEHAKTREAFGKLISQYQGVSFPLAGSATELHAAHLMGLNAAGLLDQGAPAVKELSMTKAYSTEIGVRAVDRAMQAHGAMGFTNEKHLVEAWHSLRAVNAADGTNEILRRTIAQRLFKGDVEV